MLCIHEGFTVLPRAVDARMTSPTCAARIEDSIDRVARVMLTPYETSCPSAPIEERLERVARQDRAYASALLQVVMADAQRDPRLTALAAASRRSSCGQRCALAPEAPTGHVIRTRAAIPAFTSRISPWHQDVPRPTRRPDAQRAHRVLDSLSDVDEDSGRARSPSRHMGGAHAAMKWATTAISGFRTTRFPTATMRRADAMRRRVAPRSIRPAPRHGPHADCRAAGRW